MKFINNINISTVELPPSVSSRNFTINGDSDAVFDLKITNAAGEFYNFITGDFKANQTTSTTSVVSNDTDGSTVYINAANTNIAVGMTVTGNGVSNNVIVKSVDSLKVVLSDNIQTAAGTTLKFSAEAGLNAQKLSSSGSYKNSITFPAITSDDTYTVLLEANVANDTRLKTSEIVYDLNKDSATFGEIITKGFINNLFKSIAIKQYANTVITINSSSPTLTNFDVDISANSFTISKPRGFNSSNGFKTSFSWTFTTTNSSFIAKSRDFLDTYFETAKTQTVNGATSSSRTVILDAVDNVVSGMIATGTGLGAAGDIVLAVDIEKKLIVLNNARSISDGVTVTFTAAGSKGASAYGSELSFTNLKATLTPINVTVATASSNSTTLALEDASYVYPSSSTIIKGVGIDVDETPTSIANRVQFTEGGCDYNNDPTITHVADARIVVGLVVSGDGIPSDLSPTVASINSTTSFELSASTSGGLKENQTLTFSSNNITLSAAKTVEAGTVLEIEGSGSAVTLTGDVILTSMGSTDFTSTLQLEDFMGIGAL